MNPVQTCCELARIEGKELERNRIVDLIQERTYDSFAGNCLSWVMDTSSVEKHELLSLVKGEEF